MATDGINQVCTENSDCPDGFVCFHNMCESSNYVRFENVELEVHPPAWTEKPPQVFASLSGVELLRLKDLEPIQIQVLGGGGQNLSYKVVANQHVDGSFRQIKTSGWTNQEGFVLLHLLPSAVYHMAVFPEDKQVAPFFADDLRVTQQVVSQGHRIQMPQQDQLRRVQGRVVAGPLQAPLGVADMRVEILGWEGYPRRQRVVSSTAITAQSNPEAGFFELWLPANVESELQLRIFSTADNPNAPSMVVEDIVVQTHTDLGQLSLGEYGAPAVVTGVVTYQAAPVPGARVTFTGSVGQGTFSQTTHTAEDGSYSLSLLPGSYQAMVVPAAESRAATQVQQIEVVGAQVVDFTPLPRLIYDCQVLQPGIDGEPAAQIRVEATREAGVYGSGSIDHFVRTSHVTQTDDSGRFRLFLDPGEYSFAYIPGSQDGFHARTVEYLDIVGDDNRQTTLDESWEMLGEVTYSDRSAVPLTKVRAYINLENRSPLIGEAWTDQMGNFSLWLPAQIRQ